MLKRKFQVAKRFQEISFTLAKLGIYNIYEYFKLLFGLEVDESIKPQKIRETLEKLGPSFIKLGQFLSTRPDLIPDEIIEELIKLQDKASPIDFKVIEQILIQNYGKNYKEIFAYIDPEPIASASISQVHIGYLQSGEKVAIKVKRPNIEKLIMLDTEVLLTIVNFLEKHSKTVKELNLKGFIYEFKHTTLKEADFSVEANNIAIFRENFKDYEGFYIPKCFEEISNKDILVLEFVKGIKINEIEKIKQLGLDLKKIAEDLTDAYFKMVFIDGIYHADPHPGNLFVQKDGTIVCIDFGMVGRLSKEKKKLLYEHIIAVTTVDIELAMNFYEGLDMITEKTNIESFQAEIEIFLEKYHNKTLEKIDLKEMVLELLDIIREHHLKLPTELAYLGKTTINLEGTVRTIYPNYNLTERLTNFVKTSGIDYLKEKAQDLRRIAHMGYNAPFKLEKLYRRLIRERLTIRFLIKDMELIQEFYKHQINKIILVLLFVGTLISSSLFFIAEKNDIGDTLLILAIIFGFLSIYRLFKDR